MSPREFLVFLVLFTQFISTDSSKPSFNSAHDIAGDVNRAIKVWNLTEVTPQNSQRYLDEFMKQFRNSPYFSSTNGGRTVACPDPETDSNCQHAWLKIRETAIKSIKKALEKRRKENKLLITFNKLLEELFALKLRHKFIHRLLLLRDAKYYRNLLGTFLKKMENVREKLSMVVEKYEKSNTNTEPLNILARNHLIATQYLDQEFINENRKRKGMEKEHIWYYFHDSKWPRHMFPNSLYTVDVFNGYHRMIEDKLYGRNDYYRFEEVEDFTPKPGENWLYEHNIDAVQRTNPFDPDQNHFVDAFQIKQDLRSLLPGDWSSFGHLDFSSTETSELYNIDFYREVVGYIDMFFSNPHFSPVESFDEDSLTTLWITSIVRMLQYQDIQRQIRGGGTKEFNVTNAAFMVERCTAAFQFALLHHRVTIWTSEMFNQLGIKRPIFMLHHEKNFQWFYHHFVSSTPHRMEKLKTYVKKIKKMSPTILRQTKLETMLRWNHWCAQHNDGLEYYYRGDRIKYKRKMWRTIKELQESSHCHHTLAWEDF